MVIKQKYLNSKVDKLKLSIAILKVCWGCYGYKGAGGGGEAIWHLMDETEQNLFDWNKLENCQNGILDIYNRHVLKEERGTKGRTLAALCPKHDQNAL